MDNSRDIQNVLGGISVTYESPMSNSWNSSRYTSGSPFPKYNNIEITEPDINDEDEED